MLPGLALFAAGPKLSIRKLTTRKYTIGKRDYLFLEIETDAGITGIGEGSISGRVEIVEKAIEWFTPYLTGKDPAGIEDHWNRGYYELSRYRDGSVLMTALAAVDIALWDIEGKRLGQPIWRLTGASAPKPMRVYYSHWSQELNPRTPERLAELAAKTRTEGWTCLKVGAAERRYGTRTPSPSRCRSGSRPQGRRPGPGDRP
jgi:galactonate dehydratase